MKKVLELALIVVLSPLILIALLARLAHSAFGPRVIYVPLVIAGLFEHVGRTTTSYRTNWRIAPRHGIWTIAKVTMKPKRKRASPHDFMECPICIHGTICDEGRAYMDDHDA